MLSILPSMSGQLSNRHHILGLLGIGAQGEVVRHLPQAHLSVVAGTGDNVIVEGAPVVIQHGGSVSPEQWHHLRQLSTLLQRDDGECAAARGLPVDGQVFGVAFDEVGVPGVLADAQVVVALFASARLSEDVPCVCRVVSTYCSCSYATTRPRCDDRGVWCWSAGLRYLDALTKRPDMFVSLVCVRKGVVGGRNGGGGVNWRYAACLVVLFQTRPCAASTCALSLWLAADL